MGLTIFFFAASFLQLLYLHHYMSERTAIDLRPVASAASTDTLSDKRQPETVPWQALANLEQYSLQRRYNQANVLLMARVWTHYLGFVTGMISMLIGAVFILGKLQEPPTSASSDTAAWKFSLTTTSPGLVLAFLGTLLMVTTMVAPARIEVEDKATYLFNAERAESTVHLPEELLKGIPSAAPTNRQSPRSQ